MKQHSSLELLQPLWRNYNYSHKNTTCLHWQIIIIIIQRLWSQDHYGAIQIRLLL